MGTRNLISFFTVTPFQMGGKFRPISPVKGKTYLHLFVGRGAPAGTRSFALIVDDPDAPDPRAPKQTWVHWILYNIPAGRTSLEENFRDETKERGEGLNDWKLTGYSGPCPPVGRHHYHFKLFALDTILRGLKTPTKAQLVKAMEGHILDRTELIGTYEKTIEEQRRRAL